MSFRRTALQLDPPTIRYFAVTLAISAAIAAYCLFLLPSPETPGWNTLFRWIFNVFEPGAAVLGVGILVGALLPGVQRQGVRLADWAGRHPVALAVGFTVGTAIGALVVFRAHPLSMDEYAPWFQSKAFAAWRLTGSYPPQLIDWLIPARFQDYFFVFSRETGEVASKYWPGHALLMAPFSALGAPWLLNPVMGGLSVWLVHRIARTITQDPSLAGLAAVLTAASPVVAMNAMSFYAMPAHLTLNLAYTCLLLRPLPGRALLAGLVGSFALVLHNPVPHALYALPWLVWLTAGRERRRVLPYLMTGYAPMSLVLGIGWPAFLANLGQSSGILEPGTQIEQFAAGWWDRLRGIFTLPTGKVLVDRTLGLMKIWLWAVPGLLVLAVMGFRRLLSLSVGRLLAASALLTYFFYLLIPFDQGHGWGYRYFHSAWGCLPLLAILALTPGPASEDKNPRVKPFVAGAALLSLALSLPLRTGQVGKFVEWHLSQRPAALMGTPVVVLLDSGAGHLAQDLVQNDPFLRTRPLYMMSRGDERDQVMRQSLFGDLLRLHKDTLWTVWGTK